MDPAGWEAPGVVRGHCGAPAQAWSGGGGPPSESEWAPQDLQLEKDGESPYTSCPTPTPPRRGLWKGPSFSLIKTGKMGAGIGVGQKGGESREYEVLGRFWVEVKAGVTGLDWHMGYGHGWGRGVGWSRIQVGPGSRG